MSQFSAGKKDEEEGPADDSLERAVGERKRIVGGADRPQGVPDPELAARATRRRFTAAYKLKIVLAAEAPWRSDARSRDDRIGSSQVCCPGSS